MQQHKRSRGFRVCALVAAFCMTVAVNAARSAGTGDGVPWGELRAAELRLRELRQEAALVREAIRVLGDHGDWRGNTAVKAAQDRIAAAEAAYAKLRDEPALAEIARLRDEAELACRETIEKNVIGDEPAYAALVASLDRARKDRDALEARGKLSLDEARKLAGLRLETARLENIRAAQVKALWTHDGGKEAAAVCAEGRAKWNEAHAKGTPAGGAKGALDEARKALLEIRETALADVEPGSELSAERERVTAEESAAKARLDALYRAHGGDKSAWKQVEAVFDLPAGEDGKSAGAVTARLWFLPKTRFLRGLIVRPLDHPLLLLAAADGDLGFVDIQVPRGVDIRAGTPSCFDVALAKVAEASGHPEVAHLPFLTKATSAGVLGARNLAFWKPERCIGVVHHAGGNLHHERGSPAQWMPHVPFLAINGEFERFGPEGGGHSSGVHGIRGAYGKQTQWVMCREQLLRMRRRDPNHLISMVVQPRGDHAHWDDEMWWITAMFVRKAAQARIPAADAPATEAVLCVPLKPSDGWLGDARLDHPIHKPASYADYPGDKIEAFWHLDGEMASAVAAYHEGEFYLPDLSVKNPVDPAWGVVK